MAEIQQVINKVMSDANFRSALWTILNGRKLSDGPNMPSGVQL